MPNLDPKRYYAALNVSPSAAQAEIRLSYGFLKQAHKEGKKVHEIGKIREAYETLSDAKLRAKYDRKAGGKPQARRFNSGWLLLGLAIAFTLTVFGLFGSDLMAPFVSFDPGDNIYWKSTKRPIGMVLEYQQLHEFPEAPDQAAYRIKLSSGDVQWFAAADLHKNGKRR